MMILQLMIGVFLQASFANAYIQLMPLVIAALMLDVGILVIWYYIGVALNNGAVKGSALGEFYQFIGTAIMIAIIIATLVFISTSFYSVMGATKLMNPTAVSQLCTNIENTAQLDIIGSKNSLLSGPSGAAGSSFPGICSLISSSNGGITERLDYPLAATSVIVANLTNQTAANLNYSFTMDAFLGYLSKLSPEINICFDKPPIAIGCLVPNPFSGPIFDLHGEITPYAGYNLIYDNLNTFGTILNLSVQSFIAQLILITIFIYIWPYLIFGGLVLRSTFLTRRIGGLLIAIAVAGLVVYPLIFSFEYLTLGNGLQSSVGPTNPTGYNAIYGYNAVTLIPGANNGNYIINFFVEPNVKTIATHYDCWPGVGVATTAVSVLLPGSSSATGLFRAEAADFLQQLAPFTEYTLYLIDIVFAVNHQPFPLLVNCAPTNAVNTFFALLNSYGIIGLTAYLMPLINLVITVSSIVGLSQIFGGDTELAGLGRLV